MAKRSRAPTTATATIATPKRMRSSPPSSQRPRQRSLSPRQALAAASQAIKFESELSESQPEAEIIVPIEGSQAGTATKTEAGRGDGDNFGGID
jgi:hypothetical protein